VQHQLRAAGLVTAAPREPLPGSAERGRHAAHGRLGAAGQVSYTVAQQGLLQAAGVALVLCGGGMVFDVMNYTQQILGGVVSIAVLLVFIIILLYIIAGLLQEINDSKWTSGDE
jgi:hypothetical protein